MPAVGPLELKALGPMFQGFFAFAYPAGEPIRPAGRK